VLLTTQYLEEADRLAHRIVMIDHGQVVAEGTAAELKERLGGTMVEIDLHQRALAERLRPLLESQGAVDIDTDGNVAVHLNDGARGVLAVARLLDEQNIVPDHFAVREPTLDDVFLQLTGERPDSSDAPQPRPVPEAVR
jgi:ABC-2 type transport system ATP-binding protein